MDSAKPQKKPEIQKRDNFPESDSFSDFSENYEIKDENNLFSPNKEIGNINPKKRKSWGKYILIVFLIFLFLALGWVSFFILKVSKFSQKITIENNNTTLVKNIKTVVSPIISSRHKTLRGEEEGRINILLLGAAGENNPGKNLTDTVMIMSIDTEAKKVSLLSLPRDLYANIPDTNYYTKINSLYQYGLNNNEGVEPISRTIEEITALDIHYFLIMDFEGFKKFIDDLGGINVEVKKDIYDPRYPGPNYNYELFEIKKGLHKMDGDTALKYVRERHADFEGDFGRAKRQQQVIQSVKNKVFSLRTFLNVLTFNRILNTLGDHMKTNIQLDEINSFIWWSKQVDSQNIENYVVDAWKKESLLKVSHVYYEETRVFILVPRVGNYSEIQDLAENIFDLEKINRRKSKIESEEAKIILINQSKDRTLAVKTKNLLQKKLNIKNVSISRSDHDAFREQTTVFDRTSGKKIYTLDEIIKKLPARLSGGQAKLNEDNDDIIDMEIDADMIVLLGKDLEKIYKYEENTMEELNNASFDQLYLDLLESG